MAAISGVITVTTAGTAVQGTAGIGAGIFVIKGAIANTGNILVGNDGLGDVATTTGFELDAGQDVEYTGVLSDLWFDSTVNGEKACWLRKAAYGER